MPYKFVKKHAPGTDPHDHTQNTDTDLDPTFEADFVKHSDVDDSPVDGVIADPVSSNWAYDHQVIGQHSEIKLTPKGSSTGAEGTIFYNSNDDSVYVGTE